MSDEKDDLLNSALRANLNNRILFLDRSGSTSEIEASIEDQYVTIYDRTAFNREVLSDLTFGGISSPFNPELPAPVIAQRVEIRSGVKCAVLYVESGVSLDEILEA